MAIVNTTPRIYNTRLTNWRKILQKYQNASWADPRNNLTRVDTLRRIHVKVLRAMKGNRSAALPTDPIHRLEEKMLLTVLAGTPSVPVTPPTTLKTNLQAYWNMDEQIGLGPRADSSGNGNTLTDVMSDIGYVTAGALLRGVGMTQTDPNNGLRCNASPTFAVGPGVSISFSVWLKAAGSIANKPAFSMNDGAANQGYSLYYQSSTGYWVWWVTEDGTSTLKPVNVVLQSTFVSAGWSHWAVGYDNAAGVVWAQYNNGARITTPCANMKAANTSFIIGNYSSLGSPQQIQVDEMAYWRRSLSTAEVTKLYNGGVPLPFSSFT